MLRLFTPLTRGIFCALGRDICRFPDLILADYCGGFGIGSTFFTNRRRGDLQVHNSAEIGGSASMIRPCSSSVESTDRHTSNSARS